MYGRYKVFTPAHKYIIIPGKISNRIGNTHIKLVILSENYCISCIYLKGGIAYHIVTNKLTIYKNLCTKINRLECQSDPFPFQIFIQPEFFAPPRYTNVIAIGILNCTSYFSPVMLLNCTRY